jgi:uncharacterized protein DUF11
VHRRLVVSLALLGGLGGAVASPAGAAEVVGSTGDPGAVIGCNPNVTFLQKAIQSGTAKYIASTSGVIVSWRTFAFNTTGQFMKLKVLRLQSGTTYNVVADSGFVEIPPNGEHPIAARLPIQAGDTIGLRTNSSDPPRSGCIFPGTANDAYRSDSTDSPVGSPINFNGGDNPGYRLNLSATVEPDSDGDLFGNETQDKCPSVAGSTQGCLKADLGATTTVSQGVESDMVTVTVVARNNGPETAPGVGVSIATPSRARILSAGGPAGLCGPSGAGPLICPAVTLASGESSTFTAVTVLKAGSQSFQGGVHSQQLSEAASATQGAAGDTVSADDLTTAGVKVVAPAIGTVSAVPASFRFGSGLPVMTLRRPPPRGTTFRFSLSEPARTTLAFSRPAPGRRVSGHCVAPRRTNRTKPRCTRRLAAGGLPAFAGHPGPDQVTFKGRLSRTRKLAPGRYTLAVTAVDSAGNVSPPRTANFTLLPG